AHYLKTECPWADFAILEARDVIGGTWDLFRYPGVRSDSDMYTLCYSFRPCDSPRSLAAGESILGHHRALPAEDGTDARIRFNRRVVAASWSTEDARWTLTAHNTATGETETLTAGFLFACSGYYRYDRGYQPDFPGVDDYQGTFVHPQFWPQDL